LRDLAMAFDHVHDGGGRRGGGKHGGGARGGSRRGGGERFRRKKKQR
jgi:hypothetical protein